MNFALFAEGEPSQAEENIYTAGVIKIMPSQLYHLDQKYAVGSFTEEYISPTPVSHIPAKIADREKLEFNLDFLFCRKIKIDSSVIKMPDIKQGMECGLKK